MISLDGSNPFGLTPLEVASGIVFGGEPTPRRLDGRGPGRSPLAALEAAVLPALERGPCLVSFSGGRDSSAVLALAVSVARREGLPLPVPATNRFPSAPRTDESDWQELVITHLGLDDWVRLEHDDELDAVGPVATRILRRHGLLWPFNVHFQDPLLEAAAGGSLLTGVGGDEVFGGSRWARAAAVLSGRVRPVPRDVLCVGLALAPAPVRAAFLRRRHQLPYGWLRPEARRTATRLWAALAAREPLRLGSRLEWWRGHRYVSLGCRALELVARDHDVIVVHPFADGGFLSALARDPEFGRISSRRVAMESVLGALLPPELYGRKTKATFDDVFWNRHARAFAASWEGDGVPDDLVDVQALRETWSGHPADPHTLTLLQAAWLARESRRSAGDRRDELVRSLAD